MSLRDYPDDGSTLDGIRQAVADFTNGVVNKNASSLGQGLVELTGVKNVFLAGQAGADATQLAKFGVYYTAAADATGLGLALAQQRYLIIGHEAIPTGAAV